MAKPPCSRARGPRVRGYGENETERELAGAETARRDYGRCRLRNAERVGGGLCGVGHTCCGGDRVGRCRLNRSRSIERRHERTDTGLDESHFELCVAAPLARLGQRIALAL